MENIKNVIDFLNENIEYLEGIDNVFFCVLKKSVMDRPTGLPVPPDIYMEWLEEDLKLCQIKQRVEMRKLLIEKQEKEEATDISEDNARKEFEEIRNIKRDSKGRLNKGALLAKKDSCNGSKIYLMHEMGATVKEIVEHYGCSKSAVYRILAEHK